MEVLILCIPALFTDKYQITMMYAHFKEGTYKNKAAFEVYFRDLPFENSYVVFVGLERVIAYLKNLSFKEEDISYLKSLNEGYDEEFLSLIKNLRFTGNLYSMEEGTIAFPNEPLLRVEGNILELHLIETALLNFIGYQTLVATKAARIRQVAQKDLLLEFGARRAQEKDAALWGARAAYIGGFDATSNVLAGKKFNIPIEGTHSHSFVQTFESEEKAFRAFVDAFPNNAVLLIDTYDTLKSGLVNAIKIAAYLKEKNKSLKGIRLDSGDLATLSRKVRKILDSHGLQKVKIVASSDLDEVAILKLKTQGAKIDAWGIGTKLITAYENPALGLVYKMVAKMKKNEWIPTLKISESKYKTTLPYIKNVYRVISRKDHKAIFDLITAKEENLPIAAPRIFFQKNKIKEFHFTNLLKPIFKNGKLIYKKPTIKQIKSYHNQQLEMFKKEFLEILRPRKYNILISAKLEKIKSNLIKDISDQLNNMKYK